MAKNNITMQPQQTCTVKSNMSKKADVSIGLLELIGVIIGLVLLGLLIKTLFTGIGTLNPTEARATEVSFNNLALTINQLLQDPAPLSYAILPFFLGEKRAILGFDKITLTYVDCFSYALKTVTKQTTHPSCSQNCICLTETPLPDETTPTIQNCKPVNADYISGMLTNTLSQPFATARPFLANSIGEKLPPLPSLPSKIYDPHYSLVFHGSLCATQAQFTHDFERYALSKGYKQEINNAIASQKFGQTQLYIEKHELPTGEKIVIIDYGGAENKIQERLRTIGEIAAEQHFEFAEQTDDPDKKLFYLERLQQYPVLSENVKTRINYELALIKYRLCEKYTNMQNYEQAKKICKEAINMFNERPFWGDKTVPLSQAFFYLAKAQLHTEDILEAAITAFTILKTKKLPGEPLYAQAHEQTVHLLQTIPSTANDLSDNTLYQLADNYFNNLPLIEHEIKSLFSTEQAIQKEIQSYLNSLKILHKTYLSKYATYTNSINLNLAILEKDKDFLEKHILTSDERLPEALFSLMEIYTQSNEIEQLIKTAEKFIAIAPTHLKRAHVEYILALHYSNSVSPEADETKARQHLKNFIFYGQDTMTQKNIVSQQQTIESNLRELAAKIKAEIQKAEELSEHIRDNDERYSRAFDAIDTKDYTNAVTAFNELFTDYPPEKNTQVASIILATCAAADAHRLLPEPDYPRCTQLSSHCLAHVDKIQGHPQLKAHMIEIHTFCTAHVIS